MAFSSLRFLLSVFVFSLFLSLALSYSANYQVETPGLTSSPDITTTAVFPDAEENRFLTGQTTEVLLGFYNGADRTINVTEISAAIKHPLDFSYFLQNFSRVPYFITVPPSQSISLSYRFIPSEMLEPREYGFTVNVFYSDEDGREYQTSFFNDTVEFVEPSGVWDLPTVFTYVGLLAVLGLVGYLGFNSLANKSGSSKTTKSAPKIEYGTKKNEEIEEEWLEGTSAEVFRKRQIQKKKDRQRKNALAKKN